VVVVVVVVIVVLVMMVTVLVVDWSWCCWSVMVVLGLSDGAGYSLLVYIMLLLIIIRLVLCDTSIPIVDTYATIPVSPSSRIRRYIVAVQNTVKRLVSLTMLVFPTKNLQLV